jgi:hypothetical protein
MVAGSTKGLGESMARSVRGPEWALMCTNEPETSEGQNGAAALPIGEVAC